MRRVTRFLQLDRADKWILIQSAVLLPLVAVLLRTIGLARCWALLQRAGGRTSPLSAIRGLKSALGADATRHEWRLPGVFEDASPQAPSGGFKPPDDRSGLVGTVRIVDVAARNLPWRPSCLPRSLVLWFLLRRQGVAAELRIGVQKRQQQLEAHAWVEVDQRVVNDAPDIAAEYPPFENIAAALRVTP